MSTHKRENYMQEIICEVCKLPIDDTYHWVVDGRDWHQKWCAECHFLHREGERDIPVWHNEEAKRIENDD